MSAERVQANLGLLTRLQNSATQLVETRGVQLVFSFREDQEERDPTKKSHRLCEVSIWLSSVPDESGRALVSEVQESAKIVQYHELHISLSSSYVKSKQFFGFPLTLTGISNVEVSQILDTIKG